MARKRKARRSKSSEAGSRTLLHLNFSDRDVSDSSRHAKKVCDSKDVASIAKSYNISVSGGVFYIAEPNGGVPELTPITTIYRNLTYEFRTSHSSVGGHLFRLSTEIDGVHEGYPQYDEDEWLEEGTPGDEAIGDARATWKVPSNAPNKLYYYCNNHGGFGGDGEGYINVENLGQVGYSTGTYKSEDVSAHFTGNAGIFVSGEGYSFAGDLSIKRDFTISFWAKSEATGHSEDQCLFDFGNFTGFIESGTKSYISMPSGWSGENIDMENFLSVDFTEWNHFCLMRSDNNLRYYINGTGQGGGISYDGELYAFSNSSEGRYHSIGCTRNYKNFYKGYMDDFFVHDIAVYGRDGFTPMHEDVSGKFFSIAKDGLTAKHNASRLYFMSDGGYRDFEMYDTDSVYFRLPPTGNIIPKDNREHGKQYIYPFSGQNVIISFYKDPNVIDAQESIIKFYLDSGNGRKMMATDSGLGWTYTSESDSYFSNVKLLIQSFAHRSPEAFTDSSNYNHIISGGRILHEGGLGIQNVTDEYKFGESSISFPGTQPSPLYVGKPALSDWKWGSGEWTIDAWIKVADSGSHTVMSKWDTASASTGCSWILSTTSGSLQFDRKDTISGCGSNETIGVSALNVFEPTDWNLISVQRDNTRNQIEIFVNGAIKGSGDIAGNAALCSSDNQDLMIGDFYHTTSATHNPPVYYGWMDSIRITKEVARYNENFTIPTDRFPDRFNNRVPTINSAKRGSPFQSSPENSIGITTDLKPQNWNYYSTGDIDVNASHLIINNIQSGFTGTWSAEHWEGDKVYSSQRQVIIPDVIAGTGCVRPEITGLEARGQIMSLANPWRNCTGTSNCGEDTEKPTWTGNCLETVKTSNDIHLFPHNHGSGICGPYGWTHYRIFSGWLDGASLPGFDVDTGKRYDGSTDNKNLRFIISEEPLGGKAPRKHGPYQDCGPIANRTGSKLGDNLYREMSFSEVSGIPVTTFDFLNEYDGKFYQTTGRLLVTGNGNMHGDNAINGAACMYLTVVDKIARNSCRLSHGLEKVTCLEECPTHTHCSDYAKCTADPDCYPCIPVIVGPCMDQKRECEARCGSHQALRPDIGWGSFQRIDPIYGRHSLEEKGLVNLVYGYQQMGFGVNCQSADEPGVCRSAAKAECIASCVDGGGIARIGEQYPAGPMDLYPGEETTLSLNAVNPANWYGFTSGEYAAVANLANPTGGQFASLSGIEFYGQNMGSSFNFLSAEENDGSVFVPVFQGSMPQGGTPVRMNINRGPIPLEIMYPKKSDGKINIKVKEGTTYALHVWARGAQPIYWQWTGPSVSSSDMININHGANLNFGRGKPARGKSSVQLPLGYADKISQGVKIPGGPGDPVVSTTFKAGVLPGGIDGNGGCYSVTAYNGWQAGRYPPDQWNFKSRASSAQVCFEVLKENDPYWTNCCVDEYQRSFHATPDAGEDCVITSVRGFELWPSIMGTESNPISHPDDKQSTLWKYGDTWTAGGKPSYKNGRQITQYRNFPASNTSPASRYYGALTRDTNWSTEWHSTRGIIGLPFVVGSTSKDCYNSGDGSFDIVRNSYNWGNNSTWTSKLQSDDCHDGKDFAFSVSGCPEKIVYEVTTHKKPSTCQILGAGGFCFRNQMDNDDITASEKVTVFEDFPTAGTQGSGPYYSTFAADKIYNLSCGCGGLETQWDFPPFVGGADHPAFNDYRQPQTRPFGSIRGETGENSENICCEKTGVFDFSAGGSWPENSQCDFRVFLQNNIPHGAADVPGGGPASDRVGVSFTPGYGDVSKYLDVVNLAAINSSLNCKWAGPPDEPKDAKLWFDFIWAGGTQTGLGTYSRIKGGNLWYGSTSIMKPGGRYDMSYDAVYCSAQPSPDVGEQFLATPITIQIAPNPEATAANMKSKDTRTTPDPKLSFYRPEREVVNNGLLDPWLQASQFTRQLTDKYTNARKGGNEGEHVGGGGSMEIKKWEATPAGWINTIPWCRTYSPGEGCATCGYGGVAPDGCTFDACWAHCDARAMTEQCMYGYYWGDEAGVEVGMVNVDGTIAGKSYPERVIYPENYSESFCHGDDDCIDDKIWKGVNDEGLTHWFDADPGYLYKYVVTTKYGSIIRHDSYPGGTFVYPEAGIEGSIDRGPLVGGANPAFRATVSQCDAGACPPYGMRGKHKIYHYDDNNDTTTYGTITNGEYDDYDVEWPLFGEVLYNQPLCNGCGAPEDDSAGPIPPKLNYPWTDPGISIKAFEAAADAAQRVGTQKQPTPGHRIDAQTRDYLDDGITPAEPRWIYQDETAEWPWPHYKDVDGEGASQALVYDDYTTSLDAPYGGDFVGWTRTDANTIDTALPTPGGAVTNGHWYEYGPNRVQTINEMERLAGNRPGEPQSRALTAAGSTISTLGEGGSRGAFPQCASCPDKHPEGDQIGDLAGVYRWRKLITVPYEPWSDGCVGPAVADYCGGGDIIEVGNVPDNCMSPYRACIEDMGIKKLVYVISNMDREDGDVAGDDGEADGSFGPPGNYRATPGSHGFNKDTRNTNIWSHQNGSDLPFKIFNGWVGIYGGSPEFDGGCDPAYGNGVECRSWCSSRTCCEGFTKIIWPDQTDDSHLMYRPCGRNNVTRPRAEEGRHLLYGGAFWTSPQSLGKQWDLMFVLREGDELWYNPRTDEEWNSWFETEVLIVDVHIHNHNTDNWPNDLPNDPGSFCNNPDTDPALCNEHLEHRATHKFDYLAHGPKHCAQANMNNIDVGHAEGPGRCRVMHGMYTPNAGAAEVPLYITLINGQEVDRGGYYPSARWGDRHP